MKKIFLLALILMPLASCEYLRSWAESNDPQDPVAGPADPASTSILPQVGGSDPLDLLATVLALLGLVPAARLVTMSKPFLAAFILAIAGKKKQEVPPPTKPTVS